MPRKPDTSNDAKIFALNDTGWTSVRIGTELGIPERSVRNRLAVRDRERRRVFKSAPPIVGQKAPAAQATEGSAPDLPDADAIPADAGVDEIDYWLGVAQKQARIAEANSNPEDLSKFLRIAHMLMDQKRKMAPPPKDNIDEQPDMIAAARRAKETLVKYIKNSIECRAYVEEGKAK